MSICTSEGGTEQIEEYQKMDPERICLVTESSHQQSLQNPRW